VYIAILLQLLFYSQLLTVQILI